MVQLSQYSFPQPSHMCVEGAWQLALAHLDLEKFLAVLFTCHGSPRGFFSRGCCSLSRLCAGSPALRGGRKRARASVSKASGFSR